MKICYIINTYPKPSHSFIRREIRALEQRGVVVHRMAMRGERANLVDPADIEEHDRTEHVLDVGVARLIGGCLRQLLGQPAGFLAALGLAIRVGRRSDTGALRHLIYLAEACHIARRCRELGLGHLHAHFGTNSTTVAMLVRALGGPSYSFTTHGPEEFDSPVALCLGEKISRAAFCVAVSAFGRSQLCRWAGHEDWPRIHIVHCGIEPALFGEPVGLAPGEVVRMVSIGRLVEQKGQLALIEALALARKSGADLRLVLVGDGPMRLTIERAVKDLGLQDVVSITGWVDEARVLHELALSHAMVLPSFAEGLPMVVMEAMAAGRPVISTYIAGIPELVQPGVTGWLVPAGDTGALCDALVALAQTPADVLAEMGRAGRVRVLQRHDIAVEAAKLEALFVAATQV